MLQDLRAARSGPVSDALQVRLHDVPGALVARAYAVPGRVVLAVTDPLGQVDGTYRLDVDDGLVATCERVDDDTEPDLVLGVQGLASLWLGAGTAPGLAGRGGRRHRERARRRRPGERARAVLLAHRPARADPLLTVPPGTFAGSFTRTSRGATARTPAGGGLGPGHSEPAGRTMFIPALAALDSLLARLASDNAAAALRAEADRRLAWRYEESEYLLMAGLEGVRAAAASGRVTITMPRHISSVVPSPQST